MDKALSCFVEEGSIQRITCGVFVRPRQSRFVGNVMPDTRKVVEIITREHGETIRVHGAEKEAVNTEVLEATRKGLSAEEFEILKSTDMPAWMSDALHYVGKGNVRA